MNKSQVDRLGVRLRREEPTAADLSELDVYRHSFTAAYEAVIDQLAALTQAAPVGRPAKSTGSIVDKLRRESIRLSQIQDIAGARVVVSDAGEQDRVTRAVQDRFIDTVVMDRRQKPSNGYRAVHVIVSIGGALVEIQIRTKIQHRWAELSEKLADVVDPELKYGGGPVQIRAQLAHASSLAEIITAVEFSLAAATGSRSDVTAGARSWAAARESLARAHEAFDKYLDVIYQQATRS